MKAWSAWMLLFLSFVLPVHAQLEHSYLQFANHTNLELETELRVSGAQDMVTPGQRYIRPWQNPNWHDVGLFVDVIILEILFDIYINHTRDRWMARCDRISFFGDKDYTAEIDIRRGSDLLFTVLYRFNDLPFNLLNPTHYNIRYPDGTLDVEPWYAATAEQGNNPHAASRFIDVDGVDYKLVYGTFYEDLDPTKDVIFSLSEADPVSFALEAEPAELDDPAVLNVLTYNPGILMPLVSNDQEEEERAPVFYQAMPKNMDFIIFQEFFDPVRSARILRDLEPWYPYQTSILNAQNLIPGILMGGGVVIVSKHPILEEDDFSFKNDGQANPGGVDAFANKGVKYAKIDKNGQIIHVFGTHTHGYRSDNEDMGRWITQRIAPNRDDIVIMGGDMNTNAYNNNYHRMLDTLNACEPTYRTLTHGIRQRGTVWKDNHFIQPNDFPPGTIDYIFANSNFKVPVVSWNDVQAYRLNSTDRNFWGIFDLGDHQPVYGRFEFPSVESGDADTEICPGESLTLTASTTLTDFEAAWYKDDVLLPGETGLELEIANADASSWGGYRCEIGYSYAPDGAINGGDPFTNGYLYPGSTPGRISAEWVVVPDAANCRLAAEQFLLQAAEWSLYPNPASGEIRVEVPLGGLLTLHDLSGKTVAETCIERSGRISIDDWPAGLYLVRYSSNGIDLAPQRLVILDK